MTKINWREKMQVTDDHLSDLRYAGYSYLRQGKYSIALKFFEALALLDRDNSYDCQTLGALYLEIGNPGKAISYFDKALQLDANHAPTLLNLCKTFFMLGKQEEGLKMAHILKSNEDPKASNIARALILAYS